MALALNDCTVCEGLGVDQRGGVCRCVWRSAFRQCYNRWRCIQEQQLGVGSKSSIERFQFSNQIGRRGYLWGRRNEEFCADFELAARRALSADEHRLFRLHFLLGADWKLCCRKLGMNQGNFFHAVYRIEHKLGRLFTQLSPYALFPIEEYFSGARPRNRLSATV